MSVQDRREAQRHASGPQGEGLRAALATSNGPSARDSSEREPAEVALRRAEFRYRLLFEQAPVMYVITRDEDGVPIITDCNELFLATLGCESRADVLGRPLGDFYAPQSRAELLEHGGFQRALEGRFATEERQLLTRDGRVVETMLRAVPELDADGRTVGTRAMYVDITERKRAEKALRESEERFRLIAGTTSDVIWDSDLTTGRVWRSEGMQRLFGYGPGEEDPRMAWWHERMHPEDRDRVVAGIHAVITGGNEAWFGEYRFRRADGSYAHVHDRSYVIRDSGGRPVRLIGGITDISERKRAEEALRTKDSAIASSISPVALADLDGNVTYVNPSLVKMWGFADEKDALGKPASAFWKTKEKALEVGKALRDRGNWTGEIVAIRRDGSTFDVEMMASMVTDEGGKPICMMASVVDITDRKRAEVALRESERRYRLLADNATDLVWTTDLTFRPAYVAPSVAAVLGYSIEEAMSLTVATLLTPASFEVAKGVLLQIVAEENAKRGLVSSPRALALEHVRKDGSTVWLEAKVSFLRDEENRPVGILGVSRDITERKRAEVALRESERRYRLLAEGATDIIWIRDTNLRTTYVNAAVTRIRGYSVEEVMAQSLDEVLTPASLEVARRAFAEELAQGQVERDLSWRRTLELEATCKDGSTVWLDTSVTALRDENWRVVGVLGISRDITERKRAEEALQEAREDLESRVELRMRQGNAYGLTFRELTVLDLVVAGKSDKEIGTMLGISALTASKHLGNILHKMGAASRTEAGVRAVKEGLLDKREGRPSPSAEQ
jgi:PAS domain S-box-containing protein